MQRFSEQPGTGDGEGKKGPRPAAASVVYDDGHGKAALSVALSRQNPDQKLTEGELSCPDARLSPYEACTATTAEDGSRLVLFKGWEYPDRREETGWWYADLLTPEGYRVQAYEWNAPAEKGAPVSRPAPPLSLDRMKSLVTAEEWRPEFNAAAQTEAATRAEPALTIPELRKIATSKLWRSQGLPLPSMGPPSGRPERGGIT